MVHSAPRPHIDEPPRDRRCGRHRRRYEMRAAFVALPALIVAIRGRGTALAGFELVGDSSLLGTSSSPARANRNLPLRRSCDPVEPLRLRLRLLSPCRALGLTRPGRQVRSVELNVRYGRPGGSALHSHSPHCIAWMLCGRRAERSLSGSSARSGTRPYRRTS